MGSDNIHFHEGYTKGHAAGIEQHRAEVERLKEESDLFSSALERLQAECDVFARSVADRDSLRTRAETAESQLAKLQELVDRYDIEGDHTDGNDPVTVLGHVLERFAQHHKSNGKLRTRAETAERKLAEVERERDVLRKAVDNTHAVIVGRSEPRKMLQPELLAPMVQGVNNACDEFRAERDAARAELAKLRDLLANLANRHDPDSGHKSCADPVAALERMLGSGSV